MKKVVNTNSTTQALPHFRSEAEPILVTNHVGHQHEGFQFRDYLRIVLRHRWLIFTVTLLVVGLTALYSFLATPQYTAMATMEIKTYTPRLANTPIEMQMSEVTRQGDYLSTQVARLLSLSVADRALSDAQLRNRVSQYFKRREPTSSEPRRVTERSAENDVYVGNYEQESELLRSYLSLLSVEAVKKTALVRVKATTSSPELSARIAEGHASAFIGLVREERQTSTLEDMQFLETQATELAEKVAQAERDLATYAEEHSIVSLNKDENITVKKLEILNRLLTEATAERIRAEMEYIEVEKGDFTPSMAFSTESMSELQLAIKQAESEYAMLAKKFKPAYPKMEQQRGKVEALQENLKNLQAEARTALKARYQAKLEAEQELRQQLEVQQSKVFELSRLLVTYRIMEREYDSLKDLHQTVLRQLKEAQVAAQGHSTSVTISEHATVPETHAKPNRSRNILLAAFLGPLLGFICALFIESLDTTFHTPRDIQQFLHLPSLGVVPMFLPMQQRNRITATEPSLLEAPEEVDPNEDAAGSDLPALHEQSSEDLIAMHEPRSVASESFRALRTSLFYSAADNPPSVLLFTSSQKGEGKTTVASNLAVTLAESGKSVVIIDADLRRPSVHLMFGIAGDMPGISEYLTGQREFERVIYKTAVDRLFVIPSGTRPPNPAELIGSQRMRTFVEELKSEFDYVLIDTPPVLPVADALSLAQAVDGVVLTVRGQVTERHVAQLAVERLGQVGARVIGVVLNSVNYRSDYYYDYGSAYTYHDEHRAVSNA